jgi:hypothetical protein
LFRVYQHRHRPAYPVRRNALTSRSKLSDRFP